MAEEHARVNEQSFKFVGIESKYKNNPIGGEFNYYTTFYQENVLSPNGAHGE